MEDEAARAREWGALYAQLRAHLTARAHEDPYGKGDFWLVDDDWGGPMQKVCVFRVGLLTPALCAEIQDILGGYARPWEVMFALETDVARHPQDQGLIVSRSAIRESWDRGRMAQTFGDEFKWSAVA